MDFLETVFGITKETMDKKKASATLTAVASVAGLGALFLIDVFLNSSDGEEEAISEETLEE